MTQAVAGHGALIAYEPDPVGDQGTFVTIGELNGDIVWPELSRPATDVTPHQDTIDSNVLGVIKRSPMQFSVNFIYDDATHDHLTGMYSLIQANTFTGFRLRGPGGGPADDEWIASGQVQAITNTAPVREGARTADITVVFSGRMIIDGVIYGVSS